MIENVKINRVEPISFDFDQALFPQCREDLKFLANAAIFLEAPFTVQKPCEPIKTTSALTGEKSEFKGQIFFINSIDRDAILEEAERAEGIYLCKTDLGE